MKFSFIARHRMCGALGGFAGSFLWMAHPTAHSAQPGR
jgi:hypothetical protein